MHGSMTNCVVVVVVLACIPCTTQRPVVVVGILNDGDVQPAVENVKKRGVLDDRSMQRVLLLEPLQSQHSADAVVYQRTPIDIFKFQNLYGARTTKPKLPGAKDVLQSLDALFSTWSPATLLARTEPL